MPKLSNNMSQKMDEFIFDCLLFFVYFFFIIWIMLTEHSQWHVRNDCHDIVFKRTPNHKRISVNVRPCTCLFEMACIHTRTIHIRFECVRAHDSIALLFFHVAIESAKTSHVFLGHFGLLPLSLTATCCVYAHIFSMVSKWYSPRTRKWNTYCGWFFIFFFMITSRQCI